MPELEIPVMFCVLFLLSPGGGGTAIYGLSSSLLQDRVYKSEHLGLEQGIIFQESDSWLKILSRLGKQLL